MSSKGRFLIRGWVIVGVCAICSTIWLSCNILCLINKIFFYSYVGYPEGHILGMSIVDVLKGGWKEYFNNKYTIGVVDYENLCSQWVKV
jgi:hypothetical protein